MSAHDELEVLIEATIRTELFVRPNQSPGETARGITFELLQRMRAHNLKVHYTNNTNPSYRAYDPDGEYDELE